MNTFKISNFRIFDSNGTKIKFKPITILTGTNSSGKSSFVKALLLLKDYLHSVRTNETKNPASVQLDFTGQGLKLSNFDDVINYSRSTSDAIIFMIESTSNFAPFCFNVEYSFVASSYSRTKGELKSIKLFHDDDLLCQANAFNGRISYEFPDLKGKLMKAFLIYLKGKMFQASSHTYSKDVDEEGSEFVSAQSKSGLDTTEWRKYNCDSFNYARLRGLKELDITQAVKKFDETGIFFYFPLLEEIATASKAEVLTILQKAEPGSGFKDFIDNNGVDLKAYVISEFMSSGSDSFIDFYKQKEDEALTDYTIDDQSAGTLIFSDYLSDILNNILLSEFGLHNYVGARHDLKSVTSFCMICRFMHIWQDSRSHVSDDYVFRRKQWIGENDYAFDSYHHVAILYSQYLASLLSELLLPGCLENLQYVGNSFTPVKRLYSYEDHSSFVESISRFKKYSRIIAQNKANDKDKNEKSFISLGYDGTINYIPGSFIDKWLKEFNVASRLIIEDEPDGLGFKLFVENNINGKRTSLADQGHGITQLVSILLQIECEILNEKIKAAGGLDSYEKDRIPNYGKSILAIEEPEVSLHPSMQSKLALMFEDAVQNGIRLIVETHSEYLVRRTQAYVACLKTDDEFTANPFAVYYFNNDGTAYDLEYRRSGRFVRSFGTGFFDEASKSSLEILKREKEDRI